jgi:squalene-hopene/tetraprenyl-beta-curcumene cyclase
MGQQYRVVHPYTQAAPGGWAWTDLPGGVPDADDTSGALLALRRLGGASAETTRAASEGVRWLLDLQNRDGGIPTFCRGWGTLPFDRSSTDITAHAMRAWRAWSADLPESLQSRVRVANRRAIEFLRRQQRADGSWVPLWFGNESAPAEENPTYGTTRVLVALAEMEGDGAEEVRPMIEKGVAWLIRNQNPDGGFGCGAGTKSSVEETALSVAALSRVRGAADSEARQRALEWLVSRVETGEWRHPSPIGFYFAKLWYSERLYPQLFTVGALRAG